MKHKLIDQLLVVGFAAALTTSAHAAENLTAETAGPGGAPYTTIVTLGELAAANGTPIYLLSRERLRANFKTLDDGLPAAKIFYAVKTNPHPLVLETLHAPLERVRRQENAPNPKQELQRFAQLDSGEPPTYLLLEERGTAHARAFLVAAAIRGRRFPSAWGRTRKEAERWAAYEALLVLGGERAGAADRTR